MKGCLDQEAVALLGSLAEYPSVTEAFNVHNRSKAKLFGVMLF